MQLYIEGLHVAFGGVKALQGVDLVIPPGKILAIIGPNGAGKTTLINTVSGAYHPQRGRILLDGRDISRLPPHRIASLGIARTFQNIALFRGMTVLDNIMLGRHVKMRSNFLACALYWGAALEEEVRHREAVERIIDLLGPAGC